MDSLTGGPVLGSLAQSARTKQLRTARGILFFVGILTVVVNMGFVWFADSLVDSQIDKELEALRRQQMIVDHAAVEEFRQQSVQSLRLVNGIAVLVGFVFIACAIMVYKYPVPATVTSLVLYIGCAAAFGVIDPTTLARGWLIKLLIVGALFKAVQAALAYENERKAAALAPIPTEAPAPSI